LSGRHPIVCLVRLVRIIAALESGGAQLGALRVTRELARRGVATRTLAGEATPSGLDLFASGGVDVEVWGGRSGLQYEPSEAFAAWLEPRLQDAEVVHAHMFGGWWAAARAVPARTPLCASEHNRLRWPAAPRSSEMRDALRCVDRFFAHGDQARCEVLAAGLARERLVEGSSPIAGLGASARPGLPRPLVVYAGRLHEEKGPDLLVRALARMQSPPAALLLGSGPLEPALRRLIRALGLQRTVRLAGWVAEPAPYVAAATVAVVPSRDEAWSQSAVLAMGLGVPVVGTAVGGLRHTLANGRGLLVEPGDPEALAAGIEGVLSGRLRPDAVAGSTYAERFTVERVAGRYLRAYRELTRPGARSDLRDRMATT